MRMWMVPPKNLCRQHLLGEHVELHMLSGSLAKGNTASVRGLIRDGFLELPRVLDRHAELVAEMVRRGMNHKSPLEWHDEWNEMGGSVDVMRSYADLTYRCVECSARALEV